MDSYKLALYQQFINVISKNIDEHFEEQKDYICCKEGCSLCCQRGEYPCSEIEFEYLTIGFSYLPEETQKIILGNIEKIKKEKSGFKGADFSYQCPFLINNRCSIYNYRMVVCKTFGLIYYNDLQEIGSSNPMKIPFCNEKGLNYSKVIDEKTKIISTQKVKALGYKNEPVGYNLNFKQLKEKVGTEMLGLDFGEEKTLIDWF